jgi:nucleoside-diphosphate-sugar epimerase
MKEKVLITGGAGYIGSLLVGYMLNSGYSVVVLDNLSYGGESLLPVWGHADFAFAGGDIRSLETVRGIFERFPIDHVVHLAAIVGDPACAKRPELARAVNYDATVQLLDVAMHHQVKRFVFSSTCSNYGKMNDPDAYIDESSPLAPVSLYAELKVQVEKVILQDLPKSGGFCPVCLRFATVYGLSPRMRFDLTVNEFTKELALGRELRVYGEQFWRPYCHVRDFSRAIHLALTQDAAKVAFNVFNVGSTEENYQKSMIVDEIRKLIPAAQVAFIKSDEDPRDYRVSFKKIDTELGFGISRRVPDGIREVKKLIDDGILKDPDDPKYRNS